MVDRDQMLSDIREGHASGQHNDDWIPWLIGEVDRLKANVRRWEDKEIRRASCCNDNEEEVIRLRAKLAAHYVYVDW